MQLVLASLGLRELFCWLNHVFLYWGIDSNQIQLPRLLRLLQLLQKICFLPKQVITNKFMVGNCTIIFPNLCHLFSHQFVLVQINSRNWKNKTIDVVCHKNDFRVIYFINIPIWFGTPIQSLFQKLLMAEQCVCNWN